MTNKYATVGLPTLSTQCDYQTKTLHYTKTFGMTGNYGTYEIPLGNCNRTTYTGSILRPSPDSTPLN